MSECCTGTAGCGARIAGLVIIERISASAIFRDAGAAAVQDEPGKVQSAREADTREEEEAETPGASGALSGDSNSRSTRFENPAADWLTRGATLIANSAFSGLLAIIASAFTPAWNAVQRPMRAIRISISYANHFGTRFKLARRIQSRFGFAFDPGIRIDHIFRSFKKRRADCIATCRDCPDGSTSYFSRKRNESANGIARHAVE